MKADKTKCKHCKHCLVYKSGHDIRYYCYFNAFVTSNNFKCDYFKKRGDNKQ